MNGPSSGNEKQPAREYDEKVSTSRQPYHYVMSGLPNVYLVGVTYRIHRATGDQSAGIRCLPALLEALATAVVGKRAPLTAREVRFLRKRLAFASKDFAILVGLSAEQYSRVETGVATITPMLDRMARLVYAAVAKLQPEVASELAQVRWQAEVTQEPKIIATQDAQQHWTVKTKAA